MLTPRRRDEARRGAAAALLPPLPFAIDTPPFSTLIACRHIAFAAAFHYC